MREWIYRALWAVWKEREYSNLYLRHHLQECPEKDRALATRIFYGTIQNWACCEKAWSMHVKRCPNDKIRVLLTMSTYQLLYLDRVPRYAIINEAVQLCKKIQYSSKGLVNAVLRKVQPFTWDSSIASVALRTSIPEWLMRLWIKQYGQEQAIANAEASLHILPTYVRRNPLRIDELSFLQNEEIKDISQALPIYTGLDISNHPLYQQGKMSAQDLGSYAIVDFIDPKPDDIILDCCSAPGTKAMAMAERTQDRGSITCLDIHEHRTQLILNDAKRLSLRSIHVQQADARTYQTHKKFDRVICDVPCSGYGVLARKPDIKLHMDPTDMDTLIPIQQEILENASSHVLDGGYLIYSTCTLNKKENEFQVQRFLQNHPHFKLEREQTLFPTISSDGFYMAKMKFQKNLV